MPYDAYALNVSLLCSLSNQQYQEMFHPARTHVMTPSRPLTMMLERNGSVCLRLASNSGADVLAWEVDISDVTLPVSNFTPEGRW